MDIGEGMCCECCEMCKPDDSHTCALGQIIHYTLIKKIIKNHATGGVHFKEPSTQFNVSQKLSCQRLLLITVPLVYEVNFFCLLKGATANESIYELGGSLHIKT